jgi:hypothetical protein
VAGSSLFRFVVGVGGAVVVIATAAGVVLAARLVAGGKTALPAAAAAPMRPPTAGAVAGQLAGVANAHATLTGAGGRIEHVSCISGGRGSYACSYVRTVPGNGGVCAVALLRWTPHSASTFTVQTSGRVALAPGRCGPVTRVLHALGTSG